MLFHYTTLPHLPHVSIYWYFGTCIRTALQYRYGMVFWYPVFVPHSDCPYIWRKNSNEYQVPRSYVHHSMLAIRFACFPQTVCIIEALDRVPFYEFSRQKCGFGECSQTSNYVTGTIYGPNNPNNTLYRNK